MVFPHNGERVDIPVCKKLLIRTDGKVSRPVSMDADDIGRIERLVGASRTETLRRISSCGRKKEVTVNQPPEWVGTPLKTCIPGRAFVDTLRAVDPEGTPVTYRLLGGSKGMSIAPIVGTLRFRPRAPGTFEVHVVAEDGNGRVSELRYHLTVAGSLNAVLRAPRAARPGRNIEIDASRSVNESGSREGLVYRFDVDGDGAWDYPSSGDFGKSGAVLHTYAASGAYRVTVQVQAVDGKRATAVRTVTVTIPLRVAAGVTPPVGGAGTEFTFAATGSGGALDGGRGLMVRWDLNSDGVWDQPAEGGYSQETTIRQMWEQVGVHEVRVQGRDQQGDTASASVEVAVRAGVTIDSLVMPDTVNVNQTVTLTCYATDPDFAIVEYAWDPAGTGVFTSKSAKPSTRVSFSEPGVYNVVCAVTNENGMSGSEIRDIVVKDIATLVDAGGPYEVEVNAVLKVKGTARDPDSKIVTYFWDFDNDGDNEWSSPQNDEATHTFVKKGTCTIRFGVMTADKKISSDTATVTVSNQPPVAGAGEDIVSRRNRTVKLNGTGEDPESNIVKYEWDFDGDGNYDWSSKDTGYVEHAFEVYSHPVIRVTDSEGATDTDTARIVICPKGMQTIPEGKFCIDKYEFPNVLQETPTRNITRKSAALECRKLGKRLCKLEEFALACQGPKGREIYPYGRDYIADNCNTLGNRHIDNKVAPSGEFGTCVSKYGVFDMIGNVAEWTADGEGGDAYVAGGWWQNGGARAKCNSFMPLKKDRKYLYVGFRCCK